MTRPIMADPTAREPMTGREALQMARDAFERMEKSGKRARYSTAQVCTMLRGLELGLIMAEQTHISREAPQK